MLAEFLEFKGNTLFEVNLHEFRGQSWILSSMKITHVFQKIQNDNFNLIELLKKIGNG